MTIIPTYDRRRLCRSLPQPRSDAARLAQSAQVYASFTRAISQLLVKLQFLSLKLVHKKAGQSNMRVFYQAFPIRDALRP